MTRQSAIRERSLSRKRYLSKMYLTSDGQMRITNDKK